MNKIRFLIANIFMKLANLIKPKRKLVKKRGPRKKKELPLPGEPLDFGDKESENSSKQDARK